MDLTFLLLLAVAQQNVLTYQYDNTRAGVNHSESALAPANVNAAQFGKLFSFSLDGVVYAQPLYMSNLAIGGTVHNVIFAATEHDSLYAFDADGNSMDPLWHVNFLVNGATTVPADDTSCGQVAPEIGITGTPVIDAATNTLYVSAMTKENGKYFHRLHALDVTTGAERPGSPVVIQATVPGTGDGGPTVTLIPHNYKQRPGLLLLNGIVYVGMSSHCDIGTYHGWLLGYDASTLQQKFVFNTTPNGIGASFWNGGAAPAVDASGKIYVAAANGSFDAASGGSDLGNSYIRLSSDLQPEDYFTPFNVNELNDSDSDIGSAGVALLGDEAGSADHPHLMAGAGKEGRVYLIDRDNMGQFHKGADQVVQSIPGGISALFGNPAYFNRSVYFCGPGDQLKAFPVSNAKLGTPVASSFTYDYPGCLPTISANGSSNGIVWTLDSTPALRAYDAANVANELYDSTQSSARDALSSYVRFSAPTVANGRVYAGTQNSLEVYGLLAAPSALGVANAASGRTGAVAPGSLIAIKGTGLAVTSSPAETFPLPMTLGGASVDIANTRAPLLFASAAQINAQVPFETPEGAAAILVSKAGAVVASASLQIQDAAPGIFTPVPGHAAAINPDGSVNGASNAAPSGSFIAIYMTGLGVVDNPVPSGTAAPISPLSRVKALVTALIGGQSTKILFAGLAPGYAGLYQVNVAIPQLAPGDYPVQISVNGTPSNTAIVSVGGGPPGPRPIP